MRYITYQAGRKTTGKEKCYVGQKSFRLEYRDHDDGYVHVHVYDALLLCEQNMLLRQSAERPANVKPAHGKLNYSGTDGRHVPPFFVPGGTKRDQGTKIREGKRKGEYHE